jgi:uncharacterized Zn-binding protein involved in type VI secretion
MLEAARQGDPISHVVVPPWESVGRMAGAVVGAATGAAALVLSPFPVQLLIITTVGAAKPVVNGAKVGSAVGGAIGRVFAREKVVRAGQIASGAARVHIGGKPAARACIDIVACTMHTQSSPIIRATASLTVGGVTQMPAIVQGSKTVLIVGKPAARKGDKTACDGVIADGMKTVIIGAAAVTCECAMLWEKYLEQTKRILAPVDHDHRARNKMISAKYAELYLKDRRFRWAGLAAYASKQVGCAMDHAQQVRRGEDHPSAYDVMPYPIAHDYETMSAEMAGYTYDMLGHGNRELFLDVYPMHLFLMNHGIEKMKECAAERFPPVPPEALEGFVAIGAENPTDADLNRSLEQLALHEQINSLQKEIYSSWTFDAVLLGNEVTGRWGWPHAKPADVILESGCTDTSGGENTLTFGDAGEGEERYQLYDVQERMDWILNDIGVRYLEFVDSPKHLGDLQDIARQAR